MHIPYRIALAALALLALSTAPPAAAAQDAAPDPARFAPGSTAPLTLADFVGGWSRHGFGFGIEPDGSMSAGWRTYDIGMGDSPSTPLGKATLRFDRVEERTLYGTVLTTTGSGVLVRGPFELTEHDYGIGELRGAAALGAAAIGAPEPQGSVETLCGPRSGYAPDWFQRIRPCGA